MQILRQLPPSYHSIVDMITNTKPLPSFVEAKNILILHEARKQSIDPTSDASLTSSTALYSSHLPLENGNINLIKAKIMGDLFPGVILMFLIALILLQVLKVLKDKIKLFGGISTLGPTMAQQSSLLGALPTLTSGYAFSRHPPAVIVFQQPSAAPFGLHQQLSGTTFGA